MKTSNPYKFLNRITGVVICIVAVLIINCHKVFSEVKVYGSPGYLSKIAHLYQSTDYKVNVNGQNSFVYETDNYWDGWIKPSQNKKMQDKAAFTYFELKNETATVEITCNFPVSTVTIRPKSDNIKFTTKGNTISFKINDSRYLSVEVNDQRRPLFIFSDIIETFPAAKITYGPGVHNIGSKKPVEANTTIYIAAGAVVQGTFLCKGNNVKVYGRGILTAGHILNGMLGVMDTTTWNGDKRKSFVSDAPGMLNNGHEVSGIIMVNSPGWHMNCFGPNQNFYNLKCIAWNGQSDGPHLCGNGVMQHCFIFNNDDVLIANQGSNNTFRDCIVWKGPWGRTMTSIQNNDQSNHLWEDIDVICSETSFRNFNHACIAIKAGSKCTKENYTFRNIRIEGPLPEKSTFLCLEALGNMKIKNVTLENITYELHRTSSPDAEGIIHQAENGLIEGVKFRCVSLGGKIINSLEEGNILPSGTITGLSFENKGCEK